MSTFSRLLDLACGKPPEKGHDGDASRFSLVVSALLASLVFAALWGVAAGSRVASLAAGNVLKVPMIVLMSAIVALPAGLLAWKLSGAPGGARNLLVSFAAGMLAGCLVLGVAAPIVALYYWSSKWGGPVLGQCSAFAALVVGTVVFVRSALHRDGAETTKQRGVLAIPVMVLLIAQVASIGQLIALASPILPEHTAFDGGIDHLARKGGR